MGLRRRGVRRHGPARRARVVTSRIGPIWVGTGVEVIGGSTPLRHRRARSSALNRCHAGWEPCDRQDVLEALKQADDDAHVYVHGFNNSLAVRVSDRSSISARSHRHLRGLAVEPAVT